MCVVKLFLGFPCPGCGLLRSLWALLHLDFGGAFSFFPIWPAFLAFLLFRRYRYSGEIFLTLLFSQWFLRLVLNF